MKRLKKKLCATCAETLLEILVSLLIIVLAVAGFSTLSLTAARLNNAAQEKNEQLYSQTVTQESGSAAIQFGAVEIERDITVDHGGVNAYHSAD